MIIASERALLSIGLLPAGPRWYTALLISAALLLSGCSDPPPQLRKLSADGVILAFGDSLTFGTGAKSERSYPAVLADRLGREVVNAGVPGEVTEAGLKRLPRILDSVQPELVVLCHDGNDMLRKRGLAQAENNLRAMIRLIRESGAMVVMLGVPNPGLFLSTADFYTKVATDMQVPIEAEIIPDLLGDNQFKSDTIHPNAAGYAKIADALAAMLRERGAL